MKKFLEKMKNPEDRRYFCTLLGAKLIAVAVCIWICTAS